MAAGFGEESKTEINVVQRVAFEQAAGLPTGVSSSRVSATHSPNPNRQERIQQPVLDISRGVRPS